jgi:hypothetical protein
MATSTVLSRKSNPPGVNPSDTVTKSQLDAAAGGNPTLDELAEPMDGVWPAVDATNGPLTADAGITNTTPSFTGLTLWSWNSGRFNTQSQNWVAVPSSNGPTTNQCCANVTTSRGSFGSTGIGYPCLSDFWFTADTTKIIVAYWQYTGYAAGTGVTTSHHEVDIFAEHEGHMKGIRSTPAIWPHGSGGNQMFYRVVTFKEARRRDFRIILSAGCWLAGVYVDSAADIQKASNRPVLLGAFGDSWGEGAGNVWNSFGGNGSVYGVTWPTGASALRSNTAVQYAIATGFAVINMHQGATGPFANNSGISFTATGTGFSPFCSTSQVDFFWTTFGSRYPCAGIFGGWNDGTLPGTPYLTNMQTRYTAMIQNLLNKDPDIPVMTEGIQCKSIVAGDARDLSDQGMKAAVDAFRAAGKTNIMPFISNITDRNRVDIGAADLGPDGLHPTVKGGDHIGRNRAKKSATYQISRARVTQILSA